MDGKVLHDNINTFASDPDIQYRFPMTQHYDPKRHCIILRVGDEIPPFPSLWGMLLGNIVHNYRSCLDHVAWAIYKRGRTPNLPERQERNVYFPVAAERTAFNKSLPRKLPGARRADIAIVRRYQPYHGGKRNLHRHVLKVLDDLSVLDKHRSIQPVVPLPDEATMRIVGVTDCLITRLSRGHKRETFEAGAEIGRLYIRKTGPNPHVHVEPQFSLFPAINKRLSVEEWLDRTPRVISTLLHAFAKPPESARAMIDGLL